MKTLIIAIISILFLASCGTKEYKPFDNAINASLAKDATEIAKRKSDQRNKERMDSFKKEISKRDSLTNLNQ